MLCRQCISTVIFFTCAQNSSPLHFYCCPICITSNHKLKWNQLSIKWPNTIPNLYSSFVLCRRVYSEAGRVEESHATICSVHGEFFNFKQNSTAPCGGGFFVWFIFLSKPAICPPLMRSYQAFFSSILLF